MSILHLSQNYRIKSCVHAWIRYLTQYKLDHLSSKPYELSMSMLTRTTFFSPSNSIRLPHNLYTVHWCLGKSLQGLSCSALITDSWILFHCLCTLFLFLCAFFCFFTLNNLFPSLARNMVFMVIVLSTYIPAISSNGC